MAKCTFCNTCLRIRRVEFPQSSVNYYVCEFCGRIFKRENTQFIEETQQNSDYARSQLNLRKVKNN